MPSSEPRPVPRRTAGQAARKSSRVGHRFRIGDVSASRCCGCSTIAHDLDDAEQPHDQRQKADAVEQLGDAEGVARGAGIHVGAAQAEQQADEDHGDGLEQRAVRHHHRRQQAEHHQREIFGRGELLARMRRASGAKAASEQRPDAAGEERAERGDGERGAGAALARHLVAVEAGDDRRRLARHVDQDGGGRAAILRAVIDASEHDQRRQRREPEGDRQQHRDGGDRTDAGQHADEGAEQASRQTEKQVLRRRRGGKPDHQVADDVHVSRSRTPGSAAAGRRRRPRHRTARARWRARPPASISRRSSRRRR